MNPIQTWSSLLRFLYVRYRKQIQTLIAIMVFGGALRPYLLRIVRRLHYQATAEQPRLYYQSTPENERILSQCVTMTTKKYYPLWYLFNGHLMTIQLSRAMKTRDPMIIYERQVINYPDGGIASLDWALPPHSNGLIPRVSDGINPTKRTMLILPGLTGGSDEFYIRSLVQQMIQLGWQVVVANARGCANTPLKTLRLFSCAYTDDLRFVIQYLNTTYQFLQDALIVVGFSMGSNVLVKFLGEEKTRNDPLTTITAGISIGNPFDLVKCSFNLRSSFFYLKTYDAGLVTNLKELFFHKSNASQIFQRHPKIDIEAIRNATTLLEFDHLLTRVAFEYDTVHDYYTDASSYKWIPDIQVPLLCLNAEDDPISTSNAIPYQQVMENPCVILCTTKTGGHLAYYEDVYHPQDTTKVPTNGYSIWSVKIIAEYAQTIWKIKHE